VRRRVLALTLAGMLALLGIVAVLAYVHNADNRALQRYHVVSVLVAKQPIPAGTNAEAAISSGLLASEKFPVGSIPSGAVRQIGHADSNKVTSSPMNPGQLLVQSMLVAKSQGAVPLAIPPGREAVSVAVCLAGDVAGYVQPGAKVAIYNTGGKDAPLQFSCTSHEPPSKGGVTTSVVLPNVEVLSVIANPTESQLSSSNSTPVSGTSGVSSTSAAAQGLVLVTLVVSATQAPTLISASNSGELTLALLTPTTNVGVTGTTTSP
jgi:pilus assembly protein CpaB